MTPSLKSYTGKCKLSSIHIHSLAATITATIAKAAAAAEKKDDPQAAVVAEAASAVIASTTASAASTVPAESVASFASASTVCCTQIAHIESSNNDVYST